jgi:hypothetical protein
MDFCTKLVCLLDKLAKDKHSSLLQKSVNYRQKSFITLTKGANAIKLFCPWFVDFHTQLECLLGYADIVYQLQNTLAHYKNPLITDKKVL